MLEVKNAIVDSLKFLWTRANIVAHIQQYTLPQHLHQICKATSIYMRSGVFSSLRPAPSNCRLIHNSSSEIDWCWKLCFFPTDTPVYFILSVGVLPVFDFSEIELYFTLSIMATIATPSAYSRSNCELKYSFKFILHRIVYNGKLRKKNNHESRNGNQFICGSEKINCTMKYVLVGWCARAAGTVIS